MLREDCRLSPSRPGKIGELPTVKYQDLLALEREGYGEYVCEFGRYELAGLLKLFPRDYRRRDAQRLDIHMDVALRVDMALRVDVKLVQEISDNLGALLYDMSRWKTEPAQALAGPLEELHEQLDALQQQPDNPSLLAKAKQRWEAFQKLLDTTENALDGADKAYAKVLKIGGQLTRLWGALHGVIPLS